MPNDATRATAIPLPTLSRRSFLRHIPPAIAVGTVVAAPVAVEAAQMHPMERLHQLHDEASELMAVHNAHIGGRWELRVRAPDDQCPVIYLNVGSIGPMERLELAKAELKAAFAAAYPQVVTWKNVDDDEETKNLAAVFLLVGHKRWVA